MKHLPKVLACASLLLLVQESKAQIVPTERASFQYWTHVLQGDELRVSQDFVVRLDARKLRVAMRDLGVTRASGFDDLSVTLLQPNRAPQTQPARSERDTVFEDVESGLSAIIVMGGDSRDFAPTVAYSAFAFYAEEAREPQAALGLDRLEIPLGTASSEGLLSDVSGMVGVGAPSQAASLAELKVASANRFRVRRQRDHSLVGRVIVPQHGYDVGSGSTAVAVTQDGRLVAKILVEPDGRFTLRNLPLGFYTIYCNGPAGHACYAIELIDADEDDLPPRVSGAEKAPLEFQYVSQQANEGLGIMLIPPMLLPQVRQVVQSRLKPSSLTVGLLPGGGLAATAGSGQDNGEGQAPSTLAAGGGSSGSSSGAGGGAGGGSMAEGSSLIGIAGIAVGISALATDDDGFAASVASRIAPP